jgi:hypothetical protein
MGLYRLSEGKPGLHLAAGDSPRGDSPRAPETWAGGKLLPYECPIASRS